MSIKYTLTNYSDDPLNEIRDLIEEEINVYQSALEDNGYSIIRSEKLAGYDAAQSLIAEKGKIKIRVSRFLRGGKSMIVSVERGNYEKTIPLQVDKVEDAIAYADAVQCLVK